MLWFVNEFQSAPHFSSEANIVRRPQFALRFGFNPRLTSAARRTNHKDSYSTSLRRFNPRLTSAARRTQVYRYIRRSNRVSIRASLQQRGEQYIIMAMMIKDPVSIRASLQQRGELEMQR